MKKKMNEMIRDDMFSLSSAVYELSLMQQANMSRVKGLKDGHNTETPSYPKYLSEKDRLKTFETFPKGLEISSKDLSAAGWVYILRNDSVKCFHCGGGFKNFKLGDDPALLHAMLYSNCRYIKCVKGIDYVEKARKLRPKWLSGENISEINKEINENDESSDDEIKPPKCVICETEEANHVATSCYHVFGEECWKKMMKTSARCAFCNININEVKRIFFP
jgi:baculoviral IAP repeat-containing protein 7/8